MTVLTMGEYKYDFFISYSNAGTVGEWLKNHFLKIFEEECVNEYGNAHFKYFYWREDEGGRRWTERLRQAHASSKVMLAFLTPSYFSSSYWCNAEWEAMLKRAEFCKLPADESLIYPILFSDGKNLPQSAVEITHVDFRDFASPDPGFRDTGQYHEFRMKIRNLLPELESRIKIAPAFQCAWPELDVEALKLFTRIQPLPRLQ
jgi:phosphatidylserine/phosphatidylglycerophosphate/cardiolipin synthase-like enzyme